MSKEEAKGIASKIDGFVTVQEGELLYDLATMCRQGSIVEIGSWKGRSTVWLALGAREGGCSKVYAVDPHQGSTDHLEKNEPSTLGEFRNNIREIGIEDMVVPMVMRSEEARNHVPCPIGLLFIDGPEDASEIYQELVRWSTCMAEGGVVALHDSVSMPGPRQAAEHLYLSSRFRDIRLRGSITYARTVHEAGIKDKLMDLERLMLRRAEIVLGRIKYPEPIRKMGRKALNAFGRQ